MLFIEGLRSFFERMSARTFYITVVSYLTLVFSLALLCIIALVLRTSALATTISDLNELREETRILREKAEQVQMQRTAVNEILSKEPDFKIASYFDDTLNSLQLIAKKGKTEIARTDREDNYQETELTAQIVDVNMKQITELLYAIEQTRRIYIKKVDIAKSKKGSSLELGIVIATLLPKTE